MTLRPTQRSFGRLRVSRHEIAGAILLMAAMFSPGRTLAGEALLSKHLEQYERENGGLPTKRFFVNPHGTRQSERLFVPVLPTTVESFNRIFSTKNGAAIVRQGPDLVHSSLVLGPKRAVTYQAMGQVNQNNQRIHDPKQKVEDMVAAHLAQAEQLARQLEEAGEHNVDRERQLQKAQNLRQQALARRDWVLGQVGYPNDPQQGGMHPIAGGRYVTLALEPAMIAHLENWIATVDKASLDPLYGGCMWWLVHAMVGDGLSLAHAMGVRDAKGPQALIAKLMHAGNDRVGVVGVAVADPMAFAQMSLEQLMGELPASGVVGAIYPRIEP